jgi:hypothetical protein
MPGFGSKFMTLLRRSFWSMRAHDEGIALRRLRLAFLCRGLLGHRVSRHVSELRLDHRRHALIKLILLLFSLQEANYGLVGTCFTPAR